MPARATNPREKRTAPRGLGDGGGLSAACRPLALRALLAAGLLASLSSEARAAESEPAAAPPESAQETSDIALPRVLSAPVAYPRDGQGEALVVLELLVGVEGEVGDARLVSGADPFAAVALAASSEFRFEPAREAGLARAAWIRFEVHFTPPAPGAAAVEPSVEISSPPGRAPGKPSEVRVSGQRAAGARGLTRVEVDRVPGAFGDPFRAISALPGVGPLVTGLPVFFVRGAPPGNLGFFIDGVRVPLLYHAFLGPSVIHPRLIERVDLYAGGYPARLGRFAGGVVEASLAEPAERLEVDWSVRLVDAGVFVDTPFAGGRGNVALGGRYSYTALLLSALTDAALEYWDYQALVGYDVSRDARLSVLAFGAFDFASLPAAEGDPNARDGDNAVLFHRVDVRFDQGLGNDARLRAAVTVGMDATRGTQGLVRSETVGGRLELRARLGARALLRAGGSLSVDRYRLSLDPNTQSYLDVLELFPGRTDTVLGGYADLVLTPVDGIAITPGVRLDHYRSLGETELGVSPRLAATFQIGEGVSIEHVLGVAHQPPSFVQGIPGVAVAGLPGGLQRSVQTSAGVRAALAPELQLGVTSFYNAYFRLTDPFSLSQDLDLDAEEARVRSIGRAVGLELSLERRLLGGVGGMLSYTLSRSMRSHGRVRSLSGYDRPHVLNLALSYDLGRSWLASGRALFYSGVPGGRRLGNRRVFDRERARPFFRLDLKLEKRITLGDGAYLAIVAEAVNATLSEEVLRRPCEPDCRDVTVGPIVLPSLGVNGRF